MMACLPSCNRKAGGDRKAFSLKMAGDSKAWEDLMKHFANGTRMSESPSLPDPRFWRDDLDNLGLTGLRRLDVGDDNEYLKVIVRSVSLPRLPTDVRPLPEHFVKVPFVDEVMTKLVGTSDTPKRLVLTGMGGAGKTSIASAVARDRGLRRHFSDGVLWLNDIYGDFSKQELLRQLTALAEQFQEVVLTRRFRQGRPHRPQYDSVKFNDLTEALEFFSMWKKTYGLDHCLLVVDNVWSKVISPSLVFVPSERFTRDAHWVNWGRVPSCLLTSLGRAGSGGHGGISRSCHDPQGGRRAGRRKMALA